MIWSEEYDKAKAAIAEAIKAGEPNGTELSARDKETVGLSRALLWSEFGICRILEAVAYLLEDENYHQHAAILYRMAAECNCHDSPRHKTVSEIGVIRCGGLVVDSTTHKTILDGQPIGLTPKEFQLLETLSKHHGRLVTREHLMHALWGWDTGRENDLKLYISYLRKKLAPIRTNLIQTVYGVGYFLDYSESEAAG